MVELLLLMGLGFLGSFGHCAGMCGVITAAFSLSSQTETVSRKQQFWFHLLLNIGRILSYALVGAGIGALGSVLIAGGQLAGIGSGLRRGVSLLTGGMLIWFGMVQISPTLLPRLPLLNPMLQEKLHQALNRALMQLSLQKQWWTPLLLGLTWGLMPCGFLYAAQIKAAETGNLWVGGLSMLAFGLGTLPMMLGVGMTTALMSRDRHGQLFRLGGWITIAIGLLTLFRNGGIGDYTGYLSLLCLMIVLLARPLHRLWKAPLHYRRILGVSAFLFALAHIFHMITMGWSVEALPFLLPILQVGAWAGIGSISLMVPLTLTSFDGAQRQLGPYWRQLHLLVVPIFILAIAHTLLLGSHYLGSFQVTWSRTLASLGLGTIAVVILLLRWRRFWSFCLLQGFYELPDQHS
jgi:uncharacterized protein